MSYILFTIIDGLSYQSVKNEYTNYRLNKYGGSIMFYQLNCKNCNKKLFVYQKDGNGDLLRCYSDRIHNKNKNYKLSDKFELKCNNCDSVISKPMDKYVRKDDNGDEIRDMYELII